MLQSYKLRLGDGTVLAVDHAGLSIWLADRKAMVQPVGSNRWKPLKEFLAQERSAARRAARHQAKRSSTSTSRDALPLVYPKPRVPAQQPPGSRGGDKQPIPVRADGLPLIPPPPKPSVDPNRARRSPAPASSATVVRPSLPKDPPAPALSLKPPVTKPPSISPKPPVASSPANLSPKPAVTSPPPALSLKPLVTPPPPSISPKPPVTSPPANLSPKPAVTSPPPALSPKPSDDQDKISRLPAHSALRVTVKPPAGPIVVRPLAEERPTLSAVSAPRSPPSDEDVEWMALPELLDKPLADETLALPAGRDWQATQRWLTSQAASAYEALLARWKRMAGEAERSASAKPPASVGVYSPRKAADDGLPVLELEPLDDLPEIILEPLDDEVPAKPAVPKPAGPAAAGPAPREVPKASEGERLLESAPRRRSASPWRKRLWAVCVLASVGLLAALTFESWGPKAGPSGRIFVRDFDRLKQSSGEAQRQRRAQQEAKERLPHLSAETIRLALARSPSGVLDPPTLFQVTCDAADRGSWALTPEEAQELRALRRALLDGLLPWEAERILEYDGARARRATFPFENRYALELFARGAQALPSRSRARLQLLLGKAVAAQLRAEGAPGS